MNQAQDGIKSHRREFENTEIISLKFAYTYEYILLLCSHSYMNCYEKCIKGAVLTKNVIDLVKV